MRTSIICSLALAGLLLHAAAAAADESKSKVSESKVSQPKVVAEGTTVSLEYTLKLEDGTTADSNVGGEPLTYQQGQPQLLPALQSQLLGLKVDDTKQVTLSAADAYGPVDPKAFQQVKPDLVPEHLRKAGAALVAQDSSGRQRVARVHEVSEERIVLDLNHPLAGQTLHFDLRVVAIE